MSRAKNLLKNINEDFQSSAIVEFLGRKISFYSSFDEYQKNTQEGYFLSGSGDIPPDKNNTYKGKFYLLTLDKEVPATAEVSNTYLTISFSIDGKKVNYRYKIHPNTRICSL